MDATEVRKLGTGIMVPRRVSHFWAWDKLPTEMYVETAAMSHSSFCRVCGGSALYSLDYCGLARAAEETAAAATK
jgi:hypothetical protein